MFQLKQGTVVSMLKFQVATICKVMLTIFTSLCILVVYLLRFTPNKSPFFFVCHRLKTEIITNVQKCGSALNRSQKAKNSALSCASAACDHIHDWVYETPKVDSPLSQIAFDHAKLICFYILFFIYLFLFYQLLTFVIFPLSLKFRENGFPWECILMVLMGSQRILFTLFLLNVRKGNGQLCSVSSVASICCKCYIFFP